MLHGEAGKNIFEPTAARESTAGHAFDGQQLSMQVLIKAQYMKVFVLWMTRTNNAASLVLNCDNMAVHHMCCEPEFRSCPICSDFSPRRNRSTCDKQACCYSGSTRGAAWLMPCMWWTHAFHVQIPVLCSCVNSCCSSRTCPVVLSCAGAGYWCASFQLTTSNGMCLDASEMGIHRMSGPSD